MALPGFLNKRWLLPVFVLAGLILLSGLIFSSSLFGPRLEVFTLQRGELVQTVVASGRVATPARVDIGTQITGRVAAVPVKEGQTVRAGDLLIALAANDEKAALELAQASVQQAEVRLRQLQQLTQPTAEQAVIQAQANLINVDKQYQRTRELVAQGFVGKAQLDEAQRALDVARSQLKSAQFQLQSSKPDGSDYQLAVAGLQQAKANLAAAQAKLEHTRITAVVDGVLIARDVERGDIVQPGKILMVLSPAGISQLVVQIDEKNLRYIRMGQSAFGVTDAYPGQKFPVQVAYINPGVDAQRGSVNVKLNVLKPPLFLTQDMTVSVEIEVARSQNALSLNVEAIRDASTLHPWVMAVVDGRAVRRPVTIGIRGDKSVEITSGLNQHDVVLPATNMTIEAGQRVRPVVTKNLQS